MRVAMAARLRDEGDRRPSVECVFHALIPRPVRDPHAPDAVNALTCARDGEAIARDLFGDDVAVGPVRGPRAAAGPGDRAGGGTRGGRPARAAPRSTLLQNHGLIVAGDDEARDRRAVGGGRGGRPRAALEATAVPTADITPPAPASRRLVERLVARRRRGGSACTAPRAAVVVRRVAGRGLARRDARGSGAGRRRPADARPDRVRRLVAAVARARTVAAARGDALRRAVADAVAGHVATTGEPPVIVVAAGIGRLRDGRRAAAGRDRARALPRRDPRGPRRARARRRPGAGAGGARVHRDTGRPRRTGGASMPGDGRDAGR